MSLVKSIGSKKVNLDFNKEFINIFSDKIKTSDISFINQSLKDLHPSDTANLIENLSQETRAKLLEIEEFNLDPEIFIEIVVYCIELQRQVKLMVNQVLLKV